LGSGKMYRNQILRATQNPIASKNPKPTANREPSLSHCLTLIALRIDIHLFFHRLWAQTRRAPATQRSSTVKSKTYTTAYVASLLSSSFSLLPLALELLSLSSAVRCSFPFCFCFCFWCASLFASRLCCCRVAIRAGSCASIHLLPLSLSLSLSLSLFVVFDRFFPLPCFLR
jgi:hypothetical protein